MREEDLLQAESYRDRVSTVSKTGKRNWVYALKPKGNFYQWRNYVAYMLLLVFFIMPWIKVNDMPFFMINIVEGKFILFSKIFWPQDFFIFAVGMIVFIVFIILLTVVYGRLFCGWVCPQTIFMEFIFRKIEWWIEGSPSAQKKMNESDWNLQVVGKKVFKHSIFFLISFFIANTFLAYIVGIDGLLKIIGEPIVEHMALFTGLLVFTFLFYSVFAFVREIVCTTICPYGRLQGVMFDKDTMQIAYDYNRGEPRGKVKKGVERILGDCVACNKCVQVCPTGIDIRNGVQMECVGCTACIDACDEVMEKLNFPKKLIRYASENEISTGKKFEFNTRAKAYTALLLLLIGIMSWLVFTRKSVDTFVSRVKGQTFQEVEGGRKISNLFTAKIINKTNKQLPIQLKMEGSVGEIKLVEGNHNLILKREAVNEFSFFVIMPAERLKSQKNTIQLGIYDDAGAKIQTINTSFLGPFKQ